ncbi:MAG: type IV pilus biogenesis/stability protein PilW [Casimicrobiaceae bacterium]
MRPLILALAVTASLLFAGCASKPSQPTVSMSAEPQVQLAPTAPVTARRKAELHTELAAGYYERGQMNVALDELRLAEADDATYPKIYNVYGLVYTMLGEAPKAEAYFQRALQMAPDDSEIHHNWGAFLCSHGRPAQSIPEFEIAARDPLYKTPEIALTNAGKCSVAAGDKVAAEGYFRRALSLKPQDASAAYNLALLKYRAGLYDDARQLMRMVIQLNDAPAPALYLGMCIERKKGDRNSEDSYVQQLKNRYPNSPEAKNLDGKDC